MRLLFSTVPAHGHLLPMVPLMEAAISSKHRVAVITSQGMAEVVKQELPSPVEHLPAGPMPLQFSMEGARRTGHDLLSPMDTETVGQIFGGARFDTTIDEALEAAQHWQPDALIADTYDTVGPMIATVLVIPWHSFQITVGVSSEWPAEIQRVVDSRYLKRGLAMRAATSYLDPWPPLLRNLEVAGRDFGAPVYAIRARAHQRPAQELPQFSNPNKPTVIVTLGTVFSSTEALATVVEAVAGPEVNVLATLGFSLDGSSIAIEERDDRDGEVRFVSFAPINQLLDTASVVVGVGGAGTTLAALTRGVPLVLWPQGAETPAIAERSRLAGVATVISDAAEAGKAVTTVLRDPTYRVRATAVAAEIAKTPDAVEVLEKLLTRIPSSTAQSSEAHGPDDAINRADV